MGEPVGTETQLAPCVIENRGDLPRTRTHTLTQSSGTGDHTLTHSGRNDMLKLAQVNSGELHMLHQIATRKETRFKPLQSLRDNCQSGFVSVPHLDPVLFSTHLTYLHKASVAHACF